MEWIKQRLREFKKVWKQNYQLPDKSSEAPDKSGVDRTSPVKDSFEAKIL
jgi:hypothetical protein